MEPVGKDVQNPSSSDPLIIREKLSYLELFPFKLHNKADLASNHYFGCKINW